MSIEKIRAVAAENVKAKPASIAASIDKQLYALSRVLAQSGIELNSVGKISASALSKKLKESGVDTQRRLEAKIALERAGLLAD
jgi:thymidine phosphorylase